TSSITEGKRKKEIIKIYRLYRPISYMYNIWDALASADIVISRAGGSSIAEILARGIPSILIPFPYSSEGHQELNARSLEKAGAAIVLKNEQLSKDSLLSIIRGLLSDRERLNNLANAAKGLSQQRASSTIVEAVYEILNLPKVKEAARTKKKAKKQ
ncbi:MAG: glycosyltransferase, partial [Candidatus Saganbacteria bacterium]|nr:glycosyltransferase [Candidatus Saganbacteria bacterium]